MPFNSAGCNGWLLRIALARQIRFADKQTFLKAVDDELLPLGFSRLARSQEWSATSGSDRLWVHLNFGLGAMNPSLGVEYKDLRRHWPSLPGAVYGTMVTLTAAFDPVRNYSSEDGPSRVVSDLRQVGVATLTLLQNREDVVDVLMRSNSKHWPVASYSHRIRLAPLLLCGLARTDQALQVGQAFAASAADLDQIVPKYDEFLAALQSAVAG